MREARARIYLRKERIFVLTLSRTTVMLWIASKPCFALPAACSDHGLATAIRTALDASRIDIPPDWDKARALLLTLSGVKTHSATPQEKLGRGRVVADTTKRVIFEHWSEEVAASVRRLLVSTT